MGKFYILKILLLCAAIVCAYCFLDPQKISEAAKNFAETNRNPSVFLIVSGLGCALGFPLSFAYLYAGTSFGVLQGWLLSLVSLAASGSIGYVIGGFFSPERYAKKLSQKFGLDRDAKIFDVNFFVRAVPGIPYWTQNVMLGAIRTPFKIYTTTNLCVQGCIALAMTFLGANIFDGGNIKYAAIFALILVLATIRWGVQMRFKINNFESKKAVEEK